MTIKFQRLTRTSIRALNAGQNISENGICFERLTNGDGRFMINIMVDGKRIHRVVGKESEGVTRQQVEDYIAKLRTDARNGRLNLPQGRKLSLSFIEASKRYIEKLQHENGKDIEKKTQRFKLHMDPYFKTQPIAKLSTSNIEQYIKHRQEQGAKNATINRELAAMSHMLNKAAEWCWIEFVPCRIKRLKEDNARITYLTPEQIDRILEEARKDQSIHIYPFIVIGLNTSMRKSEMLSIRFADIDLAKRIIFIPKAKAGAREQPITESLVSFLKSYIDAARSDQIYLFESPRSASGHVISIEKPFRRVISHAGLDPKEVVRHTLRHTAITHLVQAGVDLPTVQRISGHKTLEMVVRYSHQNGEHIRSAMDRLEERYKTALPETA